jgi:peptidoglycan/LPS O-acetylase OafA/YrhL
VAIVRGVSGAASRRGELRALTALRFALALSALLYHVLFAWPGLFASPPDGMFARAVSTGYVSVNGFFVLSGFVLAYTYAGLEGEALPAGAKHFFLARFARIYPLHLVGMALSLPLLFAVGRASHVREPAIASEAWREVAAVGLLVQAWIPARALDLNGPSWSLSVEASFYVCFPWLLRALTPLRPRALGLVAAAAFGLALLAPLVHPLETAVENASLRDRLVLYDPLVHLPEFILGVCAGLVFLKTRPGGPSWRLVAAGVGLVLAVAIELGPAIPAGLIHNGLFDPLLALLIFALAATQPTGEPSARPAKMGLLGLLGRASYALYILHKPIYLWMAHESGMGREGPSTKFVLAYVALTLAVSVAMWRAIEEPARRWLRGRAS